MPRVVQPTLRHAGFDEQTLPLHVVRARAGWPASGRRPGRPEGILFVLSTGCRWRDLPPQLGCGSGHTTWWRLRAWQDAGVWDRMHRLVLDELSDAAVLD